MEDLKVRTKLLKQVAENKEHHTRALASFRECYEGLQIGPYSDEILEEIIEVGPSAISNRFREEASRQLDKSGIASPLLKANLLKGCDEVIDQFNKSIDQLVSSAAEYNKKADFDRITKTQMKVEGLYVGGNSIRHSDYSYKLLRTGWVEKAIVTTCKKVIDIESSDIRLVPSADTYYIYAVWPRSGGRAQLKAFTQPQSNTDSHFYIFWQSGTFNDIKI